ncbi:MAG: large subunit ribosomal protein L22 [Candidatus Berkelbacteria bacterium Licking1014_7]|uniref:50S ribosomal protein L22 n=1 Tax=Candidatus Berkelbacteria bacterium Licking1014_7 TaxID=2017147 RepID=A0A554LKK8_9BACT|nr:MAG: large subunit ribosomal protein L22 [Candidatus Berkelbacteria bacterium Licking1014_7]
MKTINITKRYAKIAPRKIRIVGYEIKYLTIEKAQRKLFLIKKYGARILEKMLSNGINILNEKNLEKNDFVISAIRADQGPALKRHIPRSRGRTSPLKKFQSHITIELSKK